MFLKIFKRNVFRSKRRQRTDNGSEFQPDTLEIVTSYLLHFQVINILLFVPLAGNEICKTVSIFDSHLFNINFLVNFVNR
jgi:hypothetical protein